MQSVLAACNEEAYWETAFSKMTGIIHRFNLVSVIK